jgi:hypothetical protein
METALTGRRRYEHRIHHHSQRPHQPRTDDDPLNHTGPLMKRNIRFTFINQAASHSLRLSIDTSWLA